MKKSIFSLITFIIFTNGNAFASDQTTLFGYYVNKYVSTNMSRTIEKGDRIWSDPDYFKNNQIERSDIVLYKNEKTKKRFWAGRVIGLPGEKILIKEGIVYINDKLLTESYVLEKNNVKSKQFPPIKLEVPQDSVFLMGDNRDRSNDSRFNGPVNISDIKARVSGIYLSTQLSNIGRFKKVNYP